MTRIDVFKSRAAGRAIMAAVVLALVPALGAAGTGCRRKVSEPRPKPEPAGLMLKAAIVDYITENSQVPPDGYMVARIKQATAGDGTEWAVAGIEAKSNSLDPALVIMKRPQGGEWKGVDFGTDLEETELPEDVRDELWPD